MVGRKLALVRAILRKARELKDPLEGLVAWGQQCGSNGRSHQVCHFHADAMPKELHDWCLDICRENMHALYERVWGWSDAKKRKQLQSRFSRFLVARDAAPGRTPLAYINYRFEEVEGDPVAYCYELQVVRGAQGRGLGRELMETLEQLAWAAGMRKVMLTVFTDNRPAVAFYTRLGYRLDETSPVTQLPTAAPTAAAVGTVATANGGAAAGAPVERGGPTEGSPAFQEGGAGYLIMCKTAPEAPGQALPPAQAQRAEAAEMTEAAEVRTSGVEARGRSPAALRTRDSEQPPPPPAPEEHEPGAGVSPPQPPQGPEELDEPLAGPTAGPGAEQPPQPSLVSPPPPPLLPPPQPSLVSAPRQPPLSPPPQPPLLSPHTQQLLVGEGVEGEAAAPPGQPLPPPEPGGCDQPLPPEPEHGLAAAAAQAGGQQADTRDRPSPPQSLLPPKLLALPLPLPLPLPLKRSYSQTDGEPQSVGGPCGEAAGGSCGRADLSLGAPGLAGTSPQGEALGRGAEGPERACEGPERAQPQREWAAGQAQAQTQERVEPMQEGPGYGEGSPPGQDGAERPHGRGEARTPPGAQRTRTPAPPLLHSSGPHPPPSAWSGPHRSGSVPPLDGSVGSKRPRSSEPEQGLEQGPGSVSGLGQGLEQGHRQGPSPLGRPPQRSPSPAPLVSALLPQEPVLGGGSGELATVAAGEQDLGPPPEPAGGWPAGAGPMEVDATPLGPPPDPTALAVAGVGSAPGAPLQATAAASPFPEQQQQQQQQQQGVTAEAMDGVGELGVLQQPPCGQPEARCAAGLLPPPHQYQPAAAPAAAVEDAEPRAMDLDAPQGTEPMAFVSQSPTSEAAGSMGALAEPSVVAEAAGAAAEPQAAPSDPHAAAALAEPAAAAAALVEAAEPPAAPRESQAADVLHEPAAAAAVEGAEPHAPCPAPQEPQLHAPAALAAEPEPQAAPPRCGPESGAVPAGPALLLSSSRQASAMCVSCNAPQAPAETDATVASNLTELEETGPAPPLGCAHTAAGAHVPALADLAAAEAQAPAVAPARFSDPPAGQA